MEKIVQTAGRDSLGTFAPDFAHFNDDVLFGENWNNMDIDLKTRCMITVVALMSRGLVDSSFQYHLATARQNGITRREIAEILTHAAFYAGWPKAWTAFHMAKEVWADDDAGDDDKARHQKEMVFPIGTPNDGFAQYFVGQSYLQPLSTSQVGVYNVTFEPGCRNNWHIHHADQGGGQLVLPSGFGSSGGELFQRVAGGCLRRGVQQAELRNLPFVSRICDQKGSCCLGRSLFEFAETFILVRTRRMGYNS